MRARRKRTGIWLPPSPFNAVATPGGQITNTSEQSIKGGFIAMPNAQGASAVAEQDLVGDFNEDSIPGTSKDTLADMTVGYSLQRIVGKLFLGVEQDNVEETAASTWFVTCGIIVRRVGSNGVGLDPDPFPGSYESARDPWVWRRSYILHNYGATPSPGLDGFLWPGTNSDAPGVLDGPHIDQKTRRTIKAEERLFLDIDATALDGDPASQSSTLLRFFYDLRFFGRTFTSAGNRRNAVR